MTEKALARNKDSALSVKPAASVKEVAGQFFPMVPGVDQDFRWRLPRLGIVRLGSPKIDGKMGTELDYFRLPDELATHEGFRQVLADLGEDPDKPRKLPVRLVTNSPAVNLRRSWDVYNMGGVLLSRWDGKTCAKRAKDLTMVSEPCVEPGRCQGCFVNEKSIIHRLSVLIPDAPGLGLWEIRFRSANSYANLASEMVALFFETKGRPAGIDLLLTREQWDCEQVYTDKKTGEAKITRKAHWLLHLRSNLTADERAVQLADAVVYDSEQVPEMETDIAAEDVAQDSEIGAEDADFDVGEPEGDDPEGLRDELIETCRNLLGALFTTDILRGAFVNGVMRVQVGALEDCSTDQLILLRERLEKRASEAAEDAQVSRG